MTNQLDELLKHAGVKGMKWGVRRDTRAARKRYNSYNKGMGIIDRHLLKKMTNEKDRIQYLDDKDRKWIDKVNNDVKIQKVTSRTAKEMKKVNKELKKEFGGTGLAGNAKRAMNGQLNADYMKAMKDAYTDVLADHTYSVYKMSPSKTREVKIEFRPDGTARATVVPRSNPKLDKQRASINKAIEKLKKKQAIQHSDQTDPLENLDGMFFIIKLDEDGFPDDVLSPFDDIEQSDIDDILKHVGVRGMRWGVRRDRNRPGGADGIEESKKVTDNRSTIGKHVDSLKRERQWKQVVKEMDKLNTKDIKMVTKRIELENNLKTLSKTKGVGNQKDREDYLRRQFMSDAELSRKVVRLQAKKGLHKAVNESSREQREFGERVVHIGGSLGVKYALHRTGVKKMGMSDIYDVYKNPKDNYKKAKGELIDNTVSNDILKDVLKNITKANNS